MGVKGADYSFSRPSIAALKAAGIKYVSRYLSWLPNGKCITLSEKNSLLKNGIDVYLNWEYDAQDALGGSKAGTQNATEAVKQARLLSYPKGATIYFSVDFDGVPSQQPVINAYLSAARAVCKAAGYRTGVYSGYWVMKRCFDAGVVDDGWQAYAWSLAHAGVNPGPNAVVVQLRGLNFWFDKRATLRQVQNGVNVGGADVDIDDQVGPAYSYNHPYVAPQASPFPPAGKPFPEPPLKGDFVQIDLTQVVPQINETLGGAVTDIRLFSKGARDTSVALKTEVDALNLKVDALEAKLDQILALLKPPQS